MNPLQTTAGLGSAARRRRGDPKPARSAEAERIALIRHSVLAIYLTSLIQGAVGVVYPASSAILRDRLAMGNTLYGALFLPGLTLALITSFFGHALLRRWSLKSLFVYSLLSQAVTLSLMAASAWLGRPTGLPVLIAAMVISGPAAGLLGITLNTAAIEIFPRSRSGALSALHGLLGSGAALGPMLVAAFGGAGFWGGAPLLLAVAVVILAVVARTRPVIGLAEAVVTEHGRSDIPPRLWLRSSTVLLYGMGEATFTSWAVLFLRENRRLPLAVAAGALSAFWIAMTAGRLAGSLAVRWLSPLRISLVLSAGMSLSFLLVARSQGAPDSLLRFGLAGLSCSALFPLLLSQTSAEFPDRTPQVTAVFSVSVLAGLGLGSFGVGPLRGLFGLERIYAVSALGPVLMGILLIALRRRAAEEPAEANLSATFEVASANTEAAVAEASVNAEALVAAEARATSPVKARAAAIPETAAAGTGGETEIR